MKNLAIIGGGPIGLYTAIKLAKRGHKVTLFEKRSWPIDKVCGQGIMPSGVDNLINIGMTFTPFNSFTLNSIEYIERNSILRGNLHGPAVGTKRTELSEQLFNIASQNPHITLCPETKIDSINEKEDSYTLTIGPNILEFDFIFACDGLNSWTRKNTGHSKKRIIPSRIGARIHYDIAPWSNSVQVYWSDSIEAYVTPISNKTIEVAFLWFKDSIESGANLKSKLLSHFPLLREKLIEEKSLNDFKGYGPFDEVSSSISHKNLFFLGDAYHFLDGITGEGISLGIKASNIITDNFDNFGIKEKLKINFLYMNYWIWTHLALLMSKSPFTRKIIFFFAKRNKYLFNYILKLNDLNLALLK
ncbi:NAD(P)/FAD-dependent oxidoreductase [Halobacteriovorax sp. JY17]|uniref:NAD(P)/FAD-dependent oxidoreductase n=1 Tax=Halobacteriovorax sp. JY17 TaxID=2014617 RepID=UPI000C3D8069|nr:NAD(P)/FAD-dependent oxidoreductase [Halobacteriovorax sp. JY17]PIK14860.1 MAG: hypothetical protein CES88_11045 [Halobacteriovorax sp. JY17]